MYFIKKHIPGFLAGVLVTALIFSLTLSALAITGRMTIEVDPINIQVNGETFVPTDVNGAEVPVFAYNGTTYAPLRALAEAYNLQVGYDVESNMATVIDPKATVKDPAPASDYDHWSAEEEVAYAKFRSVLGFGKLNLSKSVGLDADGNIDPNYDGEPYEYWVFLYYENRDILSRGQKAGYFTKLAKEIRKNQCGVVIVCFDPIVGAQNSVTIEYTDID